MCQRSKKRTLHSWLGKFKDEQDKHQRCLHPKFFSGYIERSFICKSASERGH